MTSAVDRTRRKQQHARVLIVDDDAVVTESLTSLLELETDYDIIPSYSAPEAVRILQDTPVDLIISDFLMPKMNGLQLLAEAKRLHPEVPRILLTGYADKENAIRAINEVGLFQFVEKPWDNEHLLLVIQNAIANRTLQEALTERIHELDDAMRQRSRLKERDEAMREELRQARQLQQSMFPDSFPTSNGLVIKASYHPALDIGGDFYDAITLSEDRIALLVADATGHGIPAALSTALLKFAFSQFQHGAADATAIVEGMNQVLYRGLPADTFVACAVTVVDPRSAECRIVNAGLPHPYHIQPSKNNASPVPTEGFMLGVVENNLYEPANEVTVSLQNGDTLLFYTDGLSEVENGDGEQFDDRMLREVLAARTGEPCEKLCDTLMHSSKEFSRPDHNWDDVTIVGISLNC